MKIKLLTPLIVLTTLSGTLFFSCKKDSHPTIPPTDSSGVVDLKKGLLLYLPFTNSIADSSGNGNPTQLSGGPVLTTDRNGYSNSAFGTTGQGEEVVVTNNGSIKFDTAYTLSLAFMVKNYGSQTFVSFVDPTNANGPTFNIGMGTTVPGGQYLDLGLGDATAGCNNSGANDPNKILATTAFVPNLNVWYNATYVYQRGTIRIYLNGALILTKNGSGSTALLCPSSKFIVGAWWNSDKQGINGKLDNIRLYNRVLTPEEIAKLAEGYSTPPTTPVADLKKGLLVYLPFNGSLADSSGNNNPTQIVGTGAGLTYDIHGYANSAFGSDGSSGRLEVSSNGSIQFDTAFSVSLSFMERVVTPRQALASMVRVETGKGPSFFIGNSRDASNLWIGVPKSSCDDYGSSDLTDTTDFVPQPESWYNLICTFRNGVLRVYLNGNLFSQKTTSSYNSHVCPDAKFVVGGWWQNDPIPVNGKIDNVRLYNRELNAEEIAILSQYYQPTTNSIRQVVRH